MPNDKLTNWWDFSIDEQLRADEGQREINGENRINPTIEGDRKLITYHAYLKLDDLLDAQYPATKIPDERIFIITHQMFELAFKQIMFDIQVVVSTLNHLIAENQNTIMGLVGRSADADQDGFWRPAVFAANRIAYTCKDMLPAIMTFLSGSEATGGTLFSSQEFAYFRENLIPSSGFQSAQVRLIQRAFGKTNLLDLRNFPSQTYAKNYQGKVDDSLVSSSDKLILQEGAAIAFPESGDPQAEVVRLDRLCHQVLGRLIDATGVGEGTLSVPMIEEEIIGKVSNTVVKIMKGVNPDFDKIKLAGITKMFEENFSEVLEKENARRKEFESAPAGAKYLNVELPKSSLKLILDALSAADQAMFGNQKEAFLKKHYDIAKYHTDTLSLKGTGGGGLAYLSLSLNLLLPLFPALVGYRWK